MLHKSHPIILLLIFQPYLLSAQETTSEIGGIISDRKGPLQGASIVAVHLPSGTKYVTTSRNDGRYNLTQLRIGGPYTVTVKFIGYEESLQENIMLLLGQKFEADFLLQASVRGLSHVTVSANKENKVFNSNHTGTQEIVGKEELKYMPTINRLLIDYGRLVPFSDGFNFGGVSSLYNNFTIDGARYSNIVEFSGVQGLKVSGQMVTVEAIEQLQILLSPYDVRQGNFTGASVNGVTRSGSNKLSGSVYSFFGGQGIRGYNAGKYKIPKSEYKNTILGFNLSGPIIKDKLFFYINYENEDLVTKGTDYTATRGDDVAGENLSAANYDSLTILRNFLIDSFNYDPGEFENYKFNLKKNKLALKADWNINSKHNFLLKYNYFSGFQDLPCSNADAPAGNRLPSSTGLPFKNSGSTNFNRFHIIIAELNSRFNNKTANKLQVGYKDLYYYRKNMGIDTFPFVDITDSKGESYTAFGTDPVSYNSTLRFSAFQFADFFTLYKGKHEFVIGTQNIINKFSRNYFPYYSGVYRFRSLSDFYNSAVYKIPNAQRYHIEYPVTPDGSLPNAIINATELGFLLQDKWLINDDLSLTLGVRADLPLFKDNLFENPSISLLPFENNTYYNVGEEPGPNVLISPRVGFNWNPGEDRKTQLRGGMGFFTGTPPYIWLNNIALGNSGQEGSILTRRVSFSPDRNEYLPDTREPSAEYSLVFTEKKIKYPQVFKTSFAIDRQIPGDLTISFEALYCKDIHSIAFTNINLPSDGTPFSGSDNRLRLNSSRLYSGTPVATASNPYISEAIFMTNSNKGYSYGLTLQARKMVSELEFSIAYTYSKVKGLSDLRPIQTRIWSERPVAGNPNSEELANSSFYQPHRFIAYLSYSKSYAKHFATTATIFYEMATCGVGSYVYIGDMNNDGKAFNDLIYIPKDKTDIVLVPDSFNGIANGTDTRTPDQIWAQLDNFIRQDKYLSSHRGRVAQRNGALLPYYTKLDLNITQDFSFVTKKTNTTHTLSVSLNIFNFLNLLNKSWGTRQMFTTSNYVEPYVAPILQYEGIVPSGTDAGKPMFSFPYLDPENEIPLTNSYITNPSILSVWNMQVGIRYSFK